MSASRNKSIAPPNRPIHSLQTFFVGLVSEIVADREKAVIAGPRAAIAAAITSGTCKEGVRSFVQEWRARQDSNL